jgi:hypothetical protein
LEGLIPFWVRGDVISPHWQPMPAHQNGHPSLRHFSLESIRYGL